MMEVKMTGAEQAAQWGTLVGIFLVAVMTQWHAKKTRKQATAAVVEARSYVQRQAQRMGEIHSLVNGAMGRALRTIMILARDRANLTQHPTDVAAAEQAARDYEEHMIRQKLTEQSQISFKAGQEAERLKYMGVKKLDPTLAPEPIPGSVPATEIKIVLPKVDPTILS